MQRNLLTLFASVLLLGGLTPVRAEAGALTESIDLVSITPMVGVEVAQIGTAGLGSSGSVLLRGFNVAPALTYGGIAGVRLGPIGLGILVQHTQGVKSLDDSDVSMTKVYGQFSVQIPFDKIVGVFHVDFGWAGLATQGLLTHGLGG